MLDKIFNFSHPITQQQLDDISAAYQIPSADIEVVNIKVQIDFDEALRPQISNIVNQINVRPGDDIYIVLPDSAVAAVLIVDCLFARGARVHLIRFGQVSFKEIISVGGLINL